MVDRNFEVIGDVISTDEVVKLPETTKVENEDELVKQKSNMIEDPTVYDSNNGNGITPCMVPDNNNIK